MATEQDKYKNSSNTSGTWVRTPTMFHDKIDSTPEAKYPAEAGRYRLYVCHACPWAHRTLMVRALKGLEECIAVTATNHVLLNLKLTVDNTNEYKGWEFLLEGGMNKKNEPGNMFYEPHGFETLSELYEHAHPGYTEEYRAMAKRPIYSVPVLFDEKTQTIVSNESSEIIVMLNEKFNQFAKNPDLDLNPESLRSKMQEVNDIVYPTINDGVYRCGFAGSQEAYNEAYAKHWAGMDQIEKHLEGKKFLCGDSITLSDIRLFATLIRYDAVYYSHFKTSRNKVVDMPNMFRFLKAVYNYPGIKGTVDVEWIVKHYYGSQKPLNPSGIWPLGPLQPGYLDYLNE